MALATSAPHSSDFFQDQHTAAQADAFWQSTPRSNPHNMAALVSAVKQVVPSTSSPTPPRPPSASQKGPGSRVFTARRPQCTHVNMVRIHGEVECSMCRRVPEVGWIYACRQDQQPGQYGDLPDIGTIPTILPDGSDYFDAKSRVAEYLEMSPSVIEGIRTKRYDAQQVDKLIQQRENLIRAINEKENVAAGGKISEQTLPSIISSVGSTPPTALTPLRNSLLPMSPAGTPVNTPNESAVVTPVKEEAKVARKVPTKCTYQVCHSCRPFFQDRMYASFQSVLEGKEPPLTAEDVQHLPIMDRNIAISIGLQQPPTPPPHDAGILQVLSFTGVQDADDADLDDEISVDWQTSTGNESDSGSDHFESSHSYPCPGPGQCPVWSRDSGCAYESGRFDDGGRAVTHGFKTDRLTPESSRIFQKMMGTPGASSTASSVSLPTPSKTAPIEPLLSTDHTFESALREELSKVDGQPMTGKFGAEDRRMIIRGKDSSSSLGSEVEVEGGVALTEEAVESGMPDIITAQ